MTAAQELLRPRGGTSDVNPLELCRVLLMLASPAGNAIYFDRPGGMFPALLSSLASSVQASGYATYDNRSVAEHNLRLCRDLRRRFPRLIPIELWRMLEAFRQVMGPGGPP